MLSINKYPVFHHAYTQPIFLGTEKSDPTDQSGPKSQKSIKVTDICAPLLEMITGVCLILNIAKVKNAVAGFIEPKLSDKHKKTFYSALNLISSSQLSNRLLVVSAIARVLFNSSIGIVQQQAGMVLVNVALLVNIPLLLKMESETRKHGPAAAGKYSKILALTNLLLTGIFTTGFIQKAHKDNADTYYIHKMDRLKTIYHLKNGVPLLRRLYLVGFESLSILKDTFKGYQAAWEDVRNTITSKTQIKSFLNPFDSQGTPARVAFSSFTMPLGALIALANVKNHLALSIIAAIVSISGNLENGLAMAKSSWEDQHEPLRMLGVFGGLTTPIAEAVLTSRNPFGPAANTFCNALQNLYVVTAWSKAKSKDKGGKAVVFNDESR